MWSGTLSGGVSKLKDGHFTNYTSADGLASNTVSSIAEGTDGSIWFGTPEGLSELSKNGWRNYTVRDGLISPDIRCLLRDSTGVLWIGTAGGLAFLRNGRVRTPRGTQEWLREPIFGMVEDSHGWLWITTRTLVLRAELSSLTGGQGLNDSDFRLYGRDDGLRGTEGVKRFRSVVKDSQGNVWFSTNRGLSMVNPDRDTVNSLPAFLRIEAVTVDGSEVNLGQPIRVPPGQQRIGFHYVGLSLANPERVRYRYRLDSFDRGWSGTVSNREATFANLSPGAYRFRVMCSNSDGIWNTEGASIDFSVLPAYYQTAWFRLACAAAVLLLLWAAYQLRVQQLKRQFAIGLEARVNERTRIARDLHDTLLQSFQGLMLRLQLVEDLLPEGKAKNQLEQSLQRADQAIAEGRRAVYDLRSSTAAPTDLAQAVRSLGEEFATENSAAFHLVVEGAARDLNPIIRDELCLITREALRNAFNHAHAHHIEVDITYGERAFRLRIRDDGEGIPTQILEEGRPGHYGLSGIRERAKQVGGKLDFWSRAGAGTEIELSIPGSIAYRTSVARPLFPFVRKKAG